MRNSDLGSVIVPRLFINNTQVKLIIVTQNSPFTNSSFL